MLTLQDIKDHIIAEYDELSLLDRLDIDMEALVNILTDYIAYRYEEFESEFN